MFLAKQMSILRVLRLQEYMPKRYKGNKKKHSSRLKKDPTQRALDHFDKYYQPVFKEKWPSIRLALLSPRKYCALINNYANSQETMANLVSDGAENILNIAKDTKASDGQNTAKKQPSQHYDEETHRDVNIIADSEGSIYDIQSANDAESDLYQFMPTKRLGSSVEQMKEQEMQQNLSYSRDTLSGVEMIPDTPLEFPQHLKAFAHDRGQFSRFAKPKQDSSGKMDCYMYDAACLLPVLALDLCNKCRVLDLCAAPGGKSLTALQTLMPDHITCVELSHSRLTRLSQVLKQYVPGRHAREELISVVCRDGVKFCENVDTPYDRVLVDVPCFNDRTVLAEQDNNLFKPGRLEERVELPKEQRNLLFAGIKACKPGGVIVYSTCTLSPIQNDGVIESTMEKIWQETKTEVKVVDIGHMAQRFREIFNFAESCRYGQLVVPNVTSNFGPMYFCKLVRVS